MYQDLDIVNIKEAAQRANEMGVHLSEYTVRRAVRSGQIPCRVVGRTYLIPWQNIVQWLNCEDGGDTFPKEDNFYRNKY